MYLSIIVPVFNEKDNISILVKEIYEKLHNIKFEIIIVDDNSTDGTIEVLKNLKKKYKDLKFIIRENLQRDLSKSCQDGFENSKYENILVMDGDLQHDPIYIPQMINELDKYNCDIVVGARNLFTNRIEHLSFTRQLVSKILINFVHILFKKKTIDPMSGYFIFKKQIYEKNKSFLFFKGYKILIDLIYSNKQNLDVRDIIINFRYRRGGVSKMNYKILIIIIIFFVRTIWLRYFKSI